jgi:hypothetical protein
LKLAPYLLVWHILKGRFWIFPVCRKECDFALFTLIFKRSWYWNKNAGLQLGLQPMWPHINGTSPFLAFIWTVILKLKV